MADNSPHTLHFFPFHILAGVDAVYHGEDVVALEPRAVRVLRYLAEHSDRVVTKEELLESVWPDVFTADGVLKTAVAKIRRAIGESWIETHHRLGYRFAGDVTPERAPASTLAAPPPPPNLPHAVTRFVGRERDVAAVREAIKVSRLVTLTGPGGIGKTRLALEAAAAAVAAALPETNDGVWLVELAVVADPAHVSHAVAAALGVREEPGRDAAGSIAAWLADRRVLVVMDNCEQVVEACARLASALLRAAGGLRILATSREALAITGETVRPVPPLAESESTSLFVDRARSNNPVFELTDANAAAVAEVCRGLDGIPLALELAAARTKLLSAEQIATRLEDRFRLLGQADRTAPARHRTLRGAVDWSHDLLSADERVLFRRLSVFAGGFTVEAAEAVGDVSDSALDLLARLVDKSLVTAAGRNGSTRFGMLETIRRYAAEKLGDAGEEERARAAHRTWVAEHMTRLYREMRGPGEGAAIRAIVADYDNARAALGSGFGPEGDAEAAARLCDALGMFWQARGLWSEGRGWLGRALAAGDAVSPVVRAGVLFWAGTLAHEQSEYETARELLEACLALRREQGHPDDVGSALNQLGHVVERMGRSEEADAYREEFLALMRETGNEGGVAAAANGLGVNALRRGDYERAFVLLSEALAILERAGDALNASVILHNLGEIALFRDEPEPAVELLERSVALAREVGAPRVVAHSTHLLGYAAVELGRREEARALLVEALGIDEEHGDREGTAYALEGLARCAVESDPERALRLAGAAEAIREAIGAPLPPVERETLDRKLVPARRALGDAAGDALRAGRATTLDRALAYAREET